jgi:hypothetical protein
MEEIMKTLKVVLIAAILAFGMTSLQAHSTNKSLKIINLSLTAAVQEPGLVNAMYTQLNMSFLKVEKPGFYTAIVKYNRNIYRIYGPRKAWVRFFQIKPATVVGKTIIHQ